MERARVKLAGLLPGVSSLDEALSNFGLKSQSTLQTTAAKFADSWAQIKNSTAVAMGDKVRAFEQYATASTAANGGVDTLEIRLQAEILRAQAAASTTGDTFETSMGGPARASTA